MALPPNTPLDPLFDPNTPLDPLFDKEHYSEALGIISYRLMHYRMLDDPQLALQLPVIVDALKVAGSIASPKAPE